MDYFRRVAEGRNAEVLGFSQLKSDLMMRLLDLPSAAKKIWDSFNPSQKETFLHYTSGVNEGFKEGKKAQEFKDLDYSPEEWEPENTIVLLLLQSFDQTKKSFLSDYLEEKNKEEWGDKAKELLMKKVCLGRIIFSKRENIKRELLLEVLLHHLTKW